MFDVSNQHIVLTPYRLIKRLSRKRKTRRRYRRLRKVIRRLVRRFKQNKINTVLRAFHTFRLNIFYVINLPVYLPKPVFVESQVKNLCDTFSSYDILTSRNLLLYSRNSFLSTFKFSNIDFLQEEIELYQGTWSAIGELYDSLTRQDLVCLFNNRSPDKFENLLLYFNKRFSLFVLQELINYLNLNYTTLRTEFLSFRRIS